MYSKVLTFVLFQRPDVRLNSALLPEAVPQAEEWMKYADKADKKVIERILKMASKKHELDNSLKRTLLPDAKDSVEKWMKDANEQGRMRAFNNHTFLVHITKYNELAMP
jgi:hypothetical protein